MKLLSSSRPCAPAGLALSGLLVILGGAACAELQDDAGDPAAAAAAVAPATTTAASPLLVGVAPLWTTRNNVVPLCWLNSGYDAEKQLIKSTVARTWGAAANLTFVWRDTCPFSGPDSDRWVRIGLRQSSTTMSSGSSNVGTWTLSSPQDPVWCADAYGSFVPCVGVELILGSNRPRLDYTVIHEFGHVLGFEHEQNREDAEARECSPELEPGYGVGPYDPESIMNGCGPRMGRLSEGDLVNVEAVYGARARRPDLLADLEGDGRADAIATNYEGSYAISSSGFGFVDWRPISAPFYGTLATLYADVDGDGDDDGIAVDYEGTFVKRSIGFGLESPTPQWAGSSYGGRRTFAGDVDGDGLADLVALDLGTAIIRRSTGSAFLYVASGPAPFGTQQTDLADVDGDGRADLIANNGKKGMVVALSNGTTFDPPQPWTSAGLGQGRLSFTADRELAFGDVDGDGRADAIAVRYAGIFVRRSDGTRFLAEERWTSSPFVGDRATLFADLGGDGLVDVVGVGNDAEHVLYSTGAGFTPFGAWTAYPFYSMP